MIALALLFIRSDSVRGPIVMASSLVVAVFAVLLLVQNLNEGTVFYLKSGGESEAAGYAMIAIEAALGLLIFALSIKYRKPLAAVLVIIQCPILIWFELTKGHQIEVENNLYVDNFSIIMALIIGVIGTLIIVYALGYMKDFQSHHADQKDRRPYFFFLMFLFISAMFGIVLSNNLIWMYFFWEVTTLCSFLLIGYTKTEEAIRNSFRAVIMNLLGGLAFVLAIVLIGNTYGILELDQLIEKGAEAARQDPVINVTVLLLAFAGITKAAQMPFNSWLLGAMVAPTPTSALLHSSTMVKAGVFIIVKLSPLLGVDSMAQDGSPGFIASITSPGFMVIMVGGLTFLLASAAAVSQSNAKRVLAYSTVANLGLIVACAGLGTEAGVWAAIMLIIFHAVTKSLLFLCVGTAEHNIGSRDIEDMDGLFGKMPRLAVFMMIGIAAMFLAPFGMLVSKWAALQSFINEGNVWVVLFIAFGSAVTLFYWTKWVGKLSVIIANRENIQDKVHVEEWGVLGSHVVMIVLISLGFPLLSKILIVPFIESVYVGGSPQAIAALSGDNMIIMVILVAVILILPLLFYGRTRKRIVPLYMAGLNEGDNLTFLGSMEKDVQIQLRNWYMAGVFKEKLMNRIGIIVTSTIFAIVFSFAFTIGFLVLKQIMGGGAE